MKSFKREIEKLMHSRTPGSFMDRNEAAVLIWYILANTFGNFSSVMSMFELETEEDWYLGKTNL